MRTSFLLSAFLLSICLNGQQKELNFSKGKDEMAKENYNQALYYFNLSIKEDSLFIDAYNERGLAKFNLGDHKGAMKDYQFVLKKDPNNASAYFGIAGIKEVWLNDRYGAISDYTRALEISLNNHDNEYAGICYFMRGLLKKKIGDENGYISDMKKGAELGDEMCITNVEFLEKMK